MLLIHIVKLCGHFLKQQQYDAILATYYGRDVWAILNTSFGKSMIGYVESVTDSTNVDFIPIVDRIAVFDNDGTMWCEQPMYFQLIFTLDRIKEMSADHPEWADTPGW